jgi:diacylglycerol kinase (ATP)
MEVFRRLYAYEAGSYELSLDGSPQTGRCFLLTFANGREYGNGIVIAPDADLSDGLLDVVIVGDGGPLRQLWRARRLVMGRTRPADGVTRCRIRTARISGAGLLCHLDGETCDVAGPIDVSVESGALNVAVPERPDGS